MQIGDIVKLKSGGAAMTVEAVWEPQKDTWSCVWWSPTQEKYESRVFPASALKPQAAA